MVWVVLGIPHTHTYTHIHTRVYTPAIDNDNECRKLQTSFGNFQIFDPTGELLLYIGEHSFKGFPANYVLPAGIAVDEDGRVYVVDQYYRRIDVYRPADLPIDKGYLSSVITAKAK